MINLFLFQETVTVRYSFSNVSEWAITVNGKPQLDSSIADNSGSFNLTDNGNYTIAFNGQFLASFGSASVDAGTQSKRFLNLAKQRTIPATTRQETVQEFVYTSIVVYNVAYRVSFIASSTQNIPIFNIIVSNKYQNGKTFTHEGRDYTIQRIDGQTETITKNIPIPSRRENYYETARFSFSFEPIRIGPKPQAPIEPLAPTLVNSQKYRVIDPQRFSHIRGKIIPQLRYWRVRYLTPYQVSSFTARGYEVASVNEDTPLSPATLYGPSVVARAKATTPQFKKSIIDEEPKPPPTRWIVQQGDIGRRHHAGRKTIKSETPSRSLNRPIDTRSQEPRARRVFS